jgi:hypothetical protein
LDLKELKYWCKVEMFMSSDEGLELIEIIEKQQKELEDWKELFFLLKKDHDLLENFQTDEWIVKAKEMGVKL